MLVLGGKAGVACAAAPPTCSPALCLMAPAPLPPASPQLVVGYDFTVPVPYWIVRNSWGGLWGTEGGYAFIEATADTVGTCKMYCSRWPPPSRREQPQRPIFLPTYRALLFSHVSTPLRPPLVHCPSFQPLMPNLPMPSHLSATPSNAYSCPIPCAHSPANGLAAMVCCNRA